MQILFSILTVLIMFIIISNINVGFIKFVLYILILFVIAFNVPPVVIPFLCLSFYYGYKSIL